MQCPKCQTDHFHRSHRRGAWEHLASLAARYPYRCRDCGYRALQSRYSSEEAAADHAPKDREVKATRGAMHWRRRRRELLLYGAGLLLLAAFLYFITRERGGASDGN
jgi:transposase-like protein